MQIALEVSIVLLILYFAIRRPIISVVLLLNIYLIKSVKEIDWFNPSYLQEDLLGQDMLFGFILPVFVSFFIIARIFFLKHRKLKYRLDIIDLLLAIIIIILFFYIFISPDFYFSLEYFLKLIFIGVIYFYVTKLLISNTRDPMKMIKECFLTFYFFGIIISMIAYAIVLTNDIVILRLTLPGIHPIPFAQAIGISFLLSLLIFITKGRVLNISNSKFLIFNNFMCLYLMISLFATNTRGILVATFFSFFFFLIFNRQRISILRKMLIFLFVFAAFFIVLYYIDTSFIFRSISQDASSGERLHAFNQCFSLFYNYPFGIGTGSFNYYSNLPYPHNLFLENLANYGLLGIFWNIFLIAVICYMLYVCLKVSVKNHYSILFFIIFLYYLIETMFSFTLWMHKGLFFGFGLLSFILMVKNYNNLVE
tara:strand:+ start:324 stop:1592 length:1269 start_codon:yes stop_codon:yes gene_type:complete